MAQTARGFSLATKPGGQVGWLLTIGLSLALVVHILRILREAWGSDTTLSHGPILWLITAGLLWVRRKELVFAPDRLSLPCLGMLGFSALAHVGAIWADIAFLKSLAFLGIALGGLGWLGGNRLLRVCVGPIGLLLFSIPWPTTLIESLSFRLQYTSSAYAALLAGLSGLPIHREGVEIAVLSADGTKAIYSMVVAQKCSGLTSLIVLLALAYLIAYFTPVRGWARLLLVATIPPLTLFANVLRLLLILFAGAYHSAALATWIHDHEQPVLIFFCSLALMGLRSLLLGWKAALPASATAPEVAP